MAKATSGKSSGGTKSNGNARSAETGKFVTKAFAKSHPKTTVTERAPSKKK
jgi:hypothetical protein